MKRHVLIYGVVGGILITLLQWTHYHFLVVEHSVEIYAGLIAITFAAFGIWLGLKLTKPRREIVVKEVPVAAGQPFAPDARKREDLGITPRELDILVLIANGMSNREIAEKLTVSLSTVQTHYAHLIEKLNLRNRTELVKYALRHGLIGPAPA